MIKIVFFAPYPEILPVIHQVFSERPESEEIEYEVIQDFYNNPLEAIGGDVVIARGFTVHTLKRRNIPCAELKSTGYDVLAAVKVCMEQGDIERIGIVGAFNMVYGASQINDMYPDLKVVCYSEDDETKLESAVLQAVEEGSQAIVGGYSTIQLARKYGVPAVMIESGVEAVNNAISEAIGVASITLYERQKQKEIANIMNYSFQGIISLDSEGYITLANTYCYSFMSERKESMIGLDIREIFPELPVEEVIKGKRRILSEVYKWGQRQVMVNCVPIWEGQEASACVLTFQSVAQIQAEEGKLRKRLHSSGFTAKYSFEHILHKGKVMEEVIQKALKFSYSDSNVLICGETGTGKELFAQSIHNSSRRRKNPFVAINCAALPENLLESELFGYVEGAFTGAARGGKMGFFEIAHKGTIFLDEIGDISPNLQSRLLRVLQEREIIRLGNDAVIPVDVRVICATNKNLKKEVELGKFRQDLLYRLDVLELNLPPLRERQVDIPYLVSRMLDFEHERTGCILQRISAEGMDLLVNYSWPGNIREMRNFCERICILCSRELAGAEEVIYALPGVKEQRAKDGGEKEYGIQKKKSPECLRQTNLPLVSVKITELERQVIVEALELFDYHRGKAAEYLQMDKSTLWRKMKKYGIKE